MTGVRVSYRALVMLRYVARHGQGPMLDDADIQWLLADHGVNLKGDNANLPRPVDKLLKEWRHARRPREIGEPISLTCWTPNRASAKALLAAFRKMKRRTAGRHHE